jgi:hypothetical protein
MKITLRKNKRSTTVKFQATGDGEGVDLKDALFAATGRGFSPVEIVEELGRKGYRGGFVTSTDTKAIADLRKAEA